MYLSTTHPYSHRPNEYIENTERIFSLPLYEVEKRNPLAFTHIYYIKEQMRGIESERKSDENSVDGADENIAQNVFFIFLPQSTHIDANFVESTSNGKPRISFISALPELVLPRRINTIACAVLCIVFCCYVYTDTHTWTPMVKSAPQRKLARTKQEEAGRMPSFSTPPPL